uniref:Uncharacterized protein n=1 Tax=Rhodnius prolixus TaxID=13249 RepID=T1H8B5_RHOPR
MAFLCHLVSALLRVLHQGCSIQPGIAVYFSKHVIRLKGV